MRFDFEVIYLNCFALHHIMRLSRRVEESSWLFADGILQLSQKILTLRKAVRIFYVYVRLQIPFDRYKSTFASEEIKSRLFKQTH